MARENGVVTHRLRGRKVTASGCFSPASFLLFVFWMSPASGAPLQGQTEDPTQAAVYGLNSSANRGGGAGVKGEGWVGVVGTGAPTPGSLGVYGSGAIGVQGETADPAQPGVYGLNSNAETPGSVGVAGRGYSGVVGFGAPVVGGVGVEGRGSIGVQGESGSPAQAGVRGANAAPDGIGVLGEALIGVLGNAGNVQGGTGVQGRGEVGVGGLSENGRGISGLSQNGNGSYGHSVAGTGILGESEQADGVTGITHNSRAAAVSGRNPGGLAGLFEGDVEIKGEIRLPGGGLEARLAALESQMKELNRINQLMDWQMPPVFGRETPQISAMRERQNDRVGMVVQGSGFLPSAKVRIRITDYMSFRVEGVSKADKAGNLEPGAYVEIPPDKVDSELFVIATDEREDLHNLTGFLWSNTVNQKK